MNKKIIGGLFLALVSSTSFAAAFLPEIIIRSRPGFAANDLNDSQVSHTTEKQSGQESDAGEAGDADEEMEEA